MRFRLLPKMSSCFVRALCIDLRRCFVRLCFLVLFSAVQSTQMKTATMTHVENMNVRQLTTNNNYKNSSPIISSELAEPMRETTLLLSRFQRDMMRAPN